MSTNLWLKHSLILLPIKCQIFREEMDIKGNRIGRYSYIGDDGQTYTVKYSAGIDGFKILEGM